MPRFIVLLVATAFCAATYAAPPTEASINTLLTVGKIQKMLDSLHGYLTQSLAQTMNASLGGQPPSDEQKRALDGVATKYEQVFRDELSWDKLRPQYVKIYQETFTQSDIDGLVAFYKSPAGVAFIDKMPIAMQKTQAMMQTHLAPVMEKMHAAVEQAVGQPKAAK